MQTLKEKTKKRSWHTPLKKNNNNNNNNEQIKKLTNKIPN